MRISYLDTLSLSMREVPELIDWILENREAERKAVFGKKGNT